MPAGQGKIVDDAVAEAVEAKPDLGQIPPIKDRGREALGGLDQRELRTAFALALRAQPRDLVAFLARLRGELEQHVGGPAIASIEIQALAAAGDVASARVLFDASASLFDSDTEAFLRTQLATAEGEDPVTAQIALYEQTQDIAALRVLVSLLASRDDTRALARYARLLFEHTGSLSDARAAARAMLAADAEDDFQALTEQVPDVLEHDRELRAHHGMNLALAGDLKQAKRVVGQLRAGQAGEAAPAGPGSPEFDLEVMVAVDTGDWESLARPLGELLGQRDRLSGPALIQAAGLARTAGLPIAKPLIDAAVARAPDDAGVLVAAYGLVHEIGAEEDYREEAQHWFQRALERSDEDGPIQSFSLRQILTHEGDWQTHVREVNNKIVGGELPLAVAAPTLRLTLTHVVLRHLVRNPRLDDMRERIAVPLFPGNRTNGIRMPEGTRLGLDISSVLTLGHLGLLETVLAQYPRPLIAAGVMRQLFQDRQRMLHHQRSRVERARRLQALLATPKGFAVVKAEGGTGPAGAAEILGAELADLLAAARRHGGVVVRPAPVHAIGSAGETAVDMTTHFPHLCDTRALLRTLSGTGRLDERTEAAARRFLELQDEGWVGSADPNPAAPLFLDGLAVEYLLTLGLLEDVLATFGAVHVHETLRDEIAALLDHEDVGEQVVAVIDRIRRALNEAFERDAVVFGPHRLDRSERRDAVPNPTAAPAPQRKRRTRRRAASNEEPPLVHLLSTLKRIDVLVIDDRAVAALGTATDEDGGVAAIATTLDMLDALRDRGVLDEAQWRHHRFTLRRAGAALVPVTMAEALAGARRSVGKESPELRAIRESVALARLRELPRFPAEVPWFGGVATNLVKAVQQAFAAFPADRAPEVARFCYGVLPDPADWAGLWPGEGFEPLGWVEGVDQVLHQSLVTAFDLDESPAREEFKAWLGREVLQPMRSEEPNRYARLVEGLRVFVLRAWDRNGDNG